MTKKKALKRLKEERVLYTSMLDALDVSFNQFLVIGQWPEEKVQHAYDLLIEREEAKLVQQAK
tara:strand:+ start:189 stop:377 length:189 start_codon:yes stop_codon:yes gene_type:complete